MSSVENQMVRVINLDTKRPIDVKLAMTGLGNNAKLYYNMVESIEPMTLVKVMNNIIEPFENK